jgi:hypothetical protein
MRTLKRIVRWSVCLLPPVLFCMALAAPAQAVQRPERGDALNCFTQLAAKKVQAIPAPDLVTHRESGAVMSTRRPIAPWAQKYVYGILWRQYQIAGGVWSQEQEARAWLAEGTIWCQALLPIVTDHGPSRLNPHWLG